MTSEEIATKKDEAEMTPEERLAWLRERVRRMLTISSRNTNEVH